MIVFKGFLNRTFPFSEHSGLIKDKIVIVEDLVIDKRVGPEHQPEVQVGQDDGDHEYAGHEKEDGQVEYLQRLEAGVRLDQLVEGKLGVSVVVPKLPSLDSFYLFYLMVRAYIY